MVFILEIINVHTEESNLDQIKDEYIDKLIEDTLLNVNEKLFRFIK